MARPMASGSELIPDETPVEGNYHQHAGVRREAGHVISTLVPSAGPATQAENGLKSFFSLSELPLQRDMHEAKRQGSQPMVSLADSHCHLHGWSPPSVRTALCLL